MKKRNDIFGAIQSQLARHRVSHPKPVSREWWRNASLRDREKALKKSFGFKVRDARFLASGSFSEVFGDRQNPMKRVFPDLSPSAAKALRKLARASMQKKKRKSTKKRKAGKMPAGLRNYWAKKRAKKASRRRNARGRIMPGGLVKWFDRPVDRPKRRRKARPAKRRAKAKRRTNPRRPRTVRAPFPMTAGQLTKYARALARATGMRVKRIKG